MSSAGLVLGCIKPDVCKLHSNYSFCSSASNVWIRCLTFQTPIFAPEFSLETRARVPHDPGSWRPPQLSKSESSSVVWNTGSTLPNIFARAPIAPGTFSRGLRSSGTRPSRRREAPPRRRLQRCKRRRRNSMPIGTRVSSRCAPGCSQRFTTVESVSSDALHIGW